MMREKDELGCDVIVFPPCREKHILVFDVDDDDPATTTRVMLDDGKKAAIANCVFVRYIMILRRSVKGKSRFRISPDRMI